MRIAYQFKYPTTDYDVQAAVFKSRYGYSLPADYIKFLRENGAGSTPSPRWFEGICSIEVVFDLCFDDNSRESSLVHCQYEEYVEEGWLSKNLLPIASAHGSHTIFCLILSGRLYGQITRRDDELLILPDDFDETTLEEMGTYVVATSINDFISKLEMEPRPYDS